MVQQITSLREPLTTHSARKGTVIGVHTLMNEELILIEETLVTIRTRERSVTSVNTVMTVEHTLLGKTWVTNRAVIAALSTMDSFMPGTEALVLEGQATKLTRKRAFDIVNTLMLCEMMAPYETFPACFTLIRTLEGVSSLVFLQEVS